MASPHPTDLTEAQLRQDSVSQSQPCADAGTHIPRSLQSQSLLRALAAYRGVRFSIKTGVRTYFAEKEARRADVLAAVADSRAWGQSHRRAA